MGSYSNNILDLILNRGRIQSDAARSSGNIWSNAIGQATGAIGQGLQAWSQHSDEKKLGEAVSAATGPAPETRPGPLNAQGEETAGQQSMGVDQIRASLPPELHERFDEGVSRAAQRAAAIQAQQAKARAEQDKLKAEHADYAAGLGMDLPELLAASSRPVDLIEGAARMAQAHGIDAGAFAPMVEQMKKSWAAAGDDPQKQKMVRDAILEQTGPYLQQWAMGGSADFKKTRAETERAKAQAQKAGRAPEAKVVPVIINNADGTQTTKFVEQKPGQEFNTGTKPHNLQHMETAGGIQTFDPITGKAGPVIAQGKPNASLSGGSAQDVKDTVAGMMDGTIPPQLPGRASKEYVSIMAEAKRRGYNLSAAAMDWTATQKHLSTINNAQQTRLNQSINALPELLDTVDSLASQWKGSRFPILNKANLALAKGGAYGSDVAAVANKLSAQIADVTADLGQVYMGGNSPTDHSLALAAKSLSGDWDEKVLHEMVKMARGNVQIRRNSINTTGVQGASQNNPYAPPAQSAQGAPVRVNSPEEAARLPKGTLYLTPDGRTMRIQ